MLSREVERKTEPNGAVNGKAAEKSVGDSYSGERKLVPTSQEQRFCLRVENKRSDSQGTKNE